MIVLPNEENAMKCLECGGPLISIYDDDGREEELFCPTCCHRYEPLPEQPENVLADELKEEG